ncbi:MAG: DUF4430 domain-containing protein [Clostridia bacterium]|nr:DUF4430 domain-containing protein [Clostridia bacterium]NLS85542.1 DUF4430 domain-containing protein [Oscillospiraceae bacterium]
MPIEKKKKLLNLIMVIAIIVLFSAGVLAVGVLKGWFGTPKSAAVMQVGEASAEITVENKIGTANIERSGVAYALKDSNVLQNGDVIETLNGSSIDVICGDNILSLDENSIVTLNVEETGATFTLNNGGTFGELSAPFALKMMDTNITLEESVFSASAFFGSANIYVYDGAVAAGENEIKAGNAANILADGVHSSSLSIDALNSFELEHVAGSAKTLCYTNDDVQKLKADRLKATQEAQQAQLLEEENEAQIDAKRKENEKKLTEKANQSGAGSSADGKINTSKAELTCTVEIRCDTILDNMENLTEGKNSYVPANGTILATSTLTFEEGETAFDVLKRACELADIQLEYAWTPVYDSYYIEGINQLYEFDCGNQSGWVYKVNGCSPNYGSSAYTLKNGDAVVWAYTCAGLGSDV